MSIQEFLVHDRDARSGQRRCPRADLAALLAAYGVTGTDLAEEWLFDGWLTPAESGAASKRREAAGWAFRAHADGGGAEEVSPDGRMCAVTRETQANLYRVRTLWVDGRCAAWTE